MTNPAEPRPESRYRTLFEQAPVGIWDEDLSAVKEYVQSLIDAGPESLREHLESDSQLVAEAIRRVRVRHVNRTAREFYGAKSEEELMQALPTLFDAGTTRVFIDEITALAAGASDFSAELVTFTLAGERRLVLMNVALLPGDADDWSQVIVAFTDLTERRRLEQSLERANEMLRRVNGDLEQFAYAAAHDLREPLRTIALYAQLLQSPAHAKPAIAAETALTYIVQNAARMQTLIDDLLAFARALEPDEPVACPLVESRTVAEEVLTAIASAIGQSGTNVVVAHTLPRVPMQSGHLRQLFQNLVMNAIKYRSPDREPEIRLTAVDSGGEVTFCVGDNGIGIDPEYQSRIFRIFDRLHGAAIEGNGIGLAVCKRIVEKYNGRIWVESEVDKGSRFYFTVPLTPKHAFDDV